MLKEQAHNIDVKTLSLGEDSYVPHAHTGFHYVGSQLDCSNHLIDLCERSIVKDKHFVLVAIVAVNEKLTAPYTLGFVNSKLIEQNYELLKSLQENGEILSITHVEAYTSKNVKIIFRNIEEIEFGDELIKFYKRPLMLLQEYHFNDIGFYATDFYYADNKITCNDFTSIEDDIINEDSVVDIMYKGYKISKDDLSSVVETNYHTNEELTPFEFTIGDTKLHLIPSNYIDTNKKHLRLYNQLLENKSYSI